MKRALIIVVILSIIKLLSYNFLETSDQFGLKSFKPTLQIVYANNEYNLSWTRLYYPVYYEVEVLTQPPESDRQPVPDQQRIASYRTLNNRFTVSNNFPFRTYWRVSAQSIFNHPLGLYSNYVSPTDITGAKNKDFSDIKPVPTALYPESAPASNKPILTWTVIPGAVSYEIEILHSPPENPNSITLSKNQLLSSREVFTNGYNADLSGYPHTHLYWRVRALDYNNNPLSVFSDTGEIFVDHSKASVLKPLINVDINAGGMPTPLYPVYSWIPVTGAVSYEVELTNQPPENPNKIESSIHRIWSTRVNNPNCYDEQPRNTPGVYYWRVRGLDANDNPVGVFSDTGQFAVNLSQGSYAATFGDSITHGGGAISYSPADCTYCFQTYLDFPTINLGKSGDTSQAMLARFDHDVLPYHPKFLIIMGGTNSLRGGVTARQVIEDLAAIGGKCIHHDIRPIFLTLPPINPKAISRAFNEGTDLNWREKFAIVNHFIRQQPYHIDIEPHLSGQNGELPEHFAIDGLHLDIEGKKIMAHLINTNWARVTQ